MGSQENTPNARILVVDDEPSNTKLLAKMLARAGYANVEITNDPREVKPLYQANRFDLILLDIRMPGLDGFGVMTELKSISVDDYVPIIVLTAATDDDTRLHALEMGAHDFATKPFEQTEILHRIRNVLEVRALYNTEKELKEQTLAGSVILLTDLMSLVQPQAMGRAARLRKLIKSAVAEQAFPDAWNIHLAAMLVRIGEVTVPAEVLARFSAGRKLPDSEAALIRRVPEVGYELIGNIPRLQLVAKIVRYQDKHFDGSGRPKDAVAGRDIPRGARLLKIVTALLDEQDQGVETDKALDAMAGQPDVFDVKLLGVVRPGLGVLPLGAKPLPESRSLEQRAPGDQLLDDVRSTDGHLLLASGEILSAAHIVKIHNLRDLYTIEEPIRVIRTAPG
jgi:response regulator RpfG family c-di-GMP phosphodiesterase